MQDRGPGRFNLDPTNEIIFGTLSSNELVIDRKRSHAHLNGSALVDALLLIDARGRDFIEEEVDCGYVVGQQQCVETTLQDEIVFAHRNNHQGLTRFVLNREAKPTSYATVILARDRVKPGLMVLISSWAGHKSKPEPWDKSLFDSPEELEASITFWKEHALIWAPADVDFSRPFGTEQDMAETYFTN